jgi:hypothetical protein
MTSPNSTPLRIFLCALFLLGLCWQAHTATIQLRSTTTLQSNITVQQGAFFEVEIVVDVGEQPSTAAEIYLTFEPDKLQIADLNSPFTRGDFYTGSVVRNKVLDGNQVGFAIVAVPSALPSGQGIVAQIQFIARAVGTTQITFNADEADWEQGRYTFFTRLDTNEPEPRSFANRIDATLTIRKTLVEIDKFALQQFVQENPGRTIFLDDFVTIAGGGDKTQLSWTAQIADASPGDPQIVAIGDTRILNVGAFLPKTKDGTAKLTLRVSLEVGETFALDSAVISIVNPNTPVIQQLPEVQFQAGSEAFILLDNFVLDNDNEKVDLGWLIESIPADLDIDGVDNGGSVQPTHRLVFRLTAGKQVEANQSFDLKLTATDLDGNFDTSTLRVTVLPRPIVTLDLTKIPARLSIFKNEEHQLDLDRLVGIQPSDAAGQIVWEAIGSEHIQVIIEDNRFVIFTPQQDWVGPAETVAFTAMFESENVGESTISVTVSEIPTQDVITFPISLVRNPVIKGEFKVVAVLEGASELTATVREVGDTEISSKTVPLNPISTSQDVWIGTYSSGAKSLAGLKILVSVSGTDSNGQEISASTKTIQF